MTIVVHQSGQHKKTSLAGYILRLHQNLSQFIIDLSVLLLVFNRFAVFSITDQKHQVPFARGESCRVASRPLQWAQGCFAMCDHILNKLLTAGLFGRVSGVDQITIGIKIEELRKFRISDIFILLKDGRLFRISLGFPADKIGIVKISNHFLFQNRSQCIAMRTTSEIHLNEYGFINRFGFFKRCVKIASFKPDTAFKLGNLGISLLILEKQTNEKAKRGKMWVTSNRHMEGVII